MPIPAVDRAVIVELSARYLHAFDRGDVDAWLDCFTEDGIFEAVPEAPATGRTALRDYAACLVVDVPVRHAPAALWVQGDGDSATMRSYFTMMRLSDPPETIQVGRYEDRLAKVAGEWKIARRRVITDWKEGN